VDLSAGAVKPTGRIPWGKLPGTSPHGPPPVGLAVLQYNEGMLPAVSPPPWLWPRAAYVHVPFCAHHCGYCDFAIAVGQDHLRDRYLDALAAELAMLGQPQPVDTLFLGGGTPTYLSARQLDRLLGAVTRWFMLQPGHEFSIEANPGTLDADKVNVLADHGVNRVSLGAQSFHPHLLGVLERDHAPADVPRAVESIRRRIAAVSLDLIFGVPGQGLAEWRADLRRALELAPDHVSTYGLTYEKGTSLWKRRRRGEVRALAEEAELALYAEAIDTLEAAGFEHYEISNFARPGKRSRHNQVYWANWAHFGCGMGAARYVGGRREMNTRNLAAYIRRVLSGESPVFQSEELPPRERARETMAVQLRRAEGIDRPAFRNQTGFDLDEVAGAALSRHVELGLLADDGTRVWLTRQGKYVADAVIERLL
jgi:oxygen-independent coproporphyrinogen III oxidase